MTIIIVILLIVSVFILRMKHRNNDVSFWEDLFRIISLKVTDYFCKGTPTKVVMLFLRIVAVMYGSTAIAYPLIRAGINISDERKYWDLYVEFQWDSVSQIVTYTFLGCVTIVVVIYLLMCKNEDKIVGFFRKVFNRFDRIDETLDNIKSQTDEVDDKIDVLLSKIDGFGSSVIKHLLPDLRESINSLKMVTAKKYLDTIWREVEIYYNKEYGLQASIMYLMGECARFTKSADSYSLHKKAYDLMKRRREVDALVLEGVIYEACRKHEYEQASAYANELAEVNPMNCWVHVPSLMQCDDLSKEVDSLPEGVKKLNTLALCIMLGGGKNHDLGVDLNTYSYYDLDNITLENFKLWILDLSVAVTRFCQSFVVLPNVCDMYNSKMKDVHSLTKTFLEQLKHTEVDNPIPDTSFLFAATGYFSDQNIHWITMLETALPTEGMKEIYTLMYAIILNDAGKYGEAKRILQEYDGVAMASIINMRFSLAYRHSDIQECEAIFRLACDKQVSIPDHLACYFFATVYNGIDSIKDCIDRVCFATVLTKKAFLIFVSHINGKDIDNDFVLQNKFEFNTAIAVYMALVAKEHISLELSIEICEHYADYSILDMRTILLIDLYKSNRVYSQKLYKLLHGLRKSHQMTVDTLSLELNFAIEVGDADRCLEITSELVKLKPDNITAWANHVQSLFRCGGHEEEIIALKSKFVGNALSVQATIALFRLYHAINETQFALDILYDQIMITKDQELKDFFISMHLNREVDRLITLSKNTVEKDDLVVLEIDGQDKECVITRGSVYDVLIGCKLGNKRIITLTDDTEVEIKSIHPKYYKMLRDIYKEIGENKSSKSIKMFNINDFDFDNDPLGSLQKMAGMTEESKARKQAVLDQYQRGELPLFCLMKEQECISDAYEKLFGSFKVCTMPLVVYQKMLEDNNEWKKRKILLDFTSIIVLFEFERRYGLSTDIKFTITKSIQLILREQIINEEKGFPQYISNTVIERLGVDIIDNTKTMVWNKLKALEKWTEDHCTVETVEEIINHQLSDPSNEWMRIQIECTILVQKGMLLLSEDWFYSKKFLKAFPMMSTFNWLVMMGIENADKWGLFMLDCGNVGYPMTAEYILSQYELLSQSKPNAYHTCLDNIRYYITSWEPVVEAAKRMVDGFVTPAKITASTNMLVVLFSAMDENTCRLIIRKEMIGATNEIWLQCLRDALRINYPLILPYW